MNSSYPNGVKWIWRLLPLLLIVILVVVAAILTATGVLSLDVFEEQREELVEWVERHYLLAPLAFMGCYILIAGVSIPGAIYLTLLGGFLFGQPASTIYVVVGATLGAIVIFLVARTTLGNPLRARAGPYLTKMERGFQKGPASYMLFLRLSPMIPFWLINIAPAFLGVELWTFAWTTFIGIIPKSFVVAQVGAGLGAILDSGEGFTIDGIFNREVTIALVALALLALLPIAIRWLRSKRKGD